MWGLGPACSIEASTTGSDQLGGVSRDPIAFLPLRQAGVLRSQSPGCLLLMQVMAKSALLGW